MSRSVPRAEVEYRAAFGLLTAVEICLSTAQLCTTSSATEDISLRAEITVLAKPYSAPESLAPKPTTPQTPAAMPSSDIKKKDSN
jgi:hypothetical protein